jgi:hypothetical protein
LSGRRAEADGQSGELLSRPRHRLLEWSADEMGRREVGCVSGAGVSCVGRAGRWAALVAPGGGLQRRCAAAAAPGAEMRRR